MKISFDGEPHELREFFGWTINRGNSNFWSTFFQGISNEFANDYSKPSTGHEKGIRDEHPRKDRIRGADTTGIKISS